MVDTTGKTCGEYLMDGNNIKIGDLVLCMGSHNLKVKTGIIVFAERSKGPFNMDVFEVLIKSKVETYTSAAVRKIHD